MTKREHAKENYDTIQLLVPKGSRSIIRQAAESAGLSVNAYIYGMIAERIEGLPCYPRQRKGKETNHTDDFSIPTDDCIPYDEVNPTDDYIPTDETNPTDDCDTTEEQEEEQAVSDSDAPADPEAERQRKEFDKFLDEMQEKIGYLDTAFESSPDVDEEWEDEYDPYDELPFPDEARQASLFRD